MRTLIGGVGYRNLRDYSFGPELVDRLQARSLPAGVEVLDLSYGPIAVYQWLLEQEPALEQAYLLGAVRRGGRGGSLRRYPWRGASEPDAQVQERIAEALTGVIGLENLLVILDRFDVLPGRVEVIEIEPADEGWGPGLSAAVEARLVETLAALCAELGAVAVGERK